MKALNYILLLGILIFTGCTSSKQNNQNYKFVEYKKLKTIKTVSPRYPKIAYDKKIEGKVNLSFIIGKNGRTRDIKVIDSYPSEIFDKSAITALSKWEFNPRIKDGKTTEIKSSITFNFKLNPKQIDNEKKKNLSVNIFKKNYAKKELLNREAPITLKTYNPYYPYTAKLEKIEGWVKLGFIVDKNGKTKSIKVIESYPKEVFEESATYAVSKWEFLPIIKDDKTYDSDRLTVTLNFKLADR